MKGKFNIITVLRTGGDFIYYDVELLSIYLKRYCPQHKFYCLWDKIDEVMDLGNMVLLPLKYKWPGWWSKMNLFSPELEHLRPFLFMDLDTAIVKDISQLAKSLEYQHKEQFVALEDFYQSGQLQSALMWIPKGLLTRHIWEEFKDKTDDHIRYFRSDQDYLRVVAGASTVFFQMFTKEITTFKPLPTKKWLEVIPKHISIVCFHGQPRICTAAASVEWVHFYYKKEYIILTE